MKSFTLRFIKAIAVLIALGAIVIATLYASGLSYIYCSFRETSWMKARSEDELERRLVAFYSKNSIKPSQSSWGSDHVLKEGQRMIRYLIFGKEPLDVVYNSDGTIDRIYTTYE